MSAIRLDRYQVDAKDGLFSCPIKCVLQQNTVFDSKKQKQR